LVVADAGESVLPALGTASYESPLHGSWTNQTVAHNTVVVDRMTQWPRSKWGHDTAEHRVCGELLAFHSDDRLQLVRARCANAHDGIALDRTVMLADGVLLDVYRARATDGAAHRFEYVLHGLGPLTVSGLDLTPAAALGEAEGYEHLTEVRQAEAYGPVSAEFGERLELVSAPGETEVIAATGLGIAGTEPLPVLLLGRTGVEAMYAVAMQPSDDTRPVNVEVQGEQLRLSVGGRHWLVGLPEEGGARMTCDAMRWEIGAPGQPTRRTGGGADREWAPVGTGGVSVW
jgi:hypothetical protein